MIGWDHSDNILNQEAYSWSQIYGINAIPTSIFDGDYRRIVGNYPSDLPGALNDCGSRPVPDIVGQLMVIWLGDAALRISVSITNKEGSTYNSYIRVPIMEIVSRYDTSGGSRYNNGFIGYAFYNKDITIEPHGTYTDTVIWDGDEHQDEHGDDFGDISKSNIKVILGVFNQDNGYVDETVTATVHENPATVIDDIPKYVKKLEENGVKIKAIVAIGSRARGNYKPWSDIDLIFIVEDVKDKEFFTIGIVDPRVYTVSEAIEAIKLCEVELIEGFEDGKVLYDDGTWNNLRELYVQVKEVYGIERYGDGWRVRKKLQ